MMSFESEPGVVIWLLSGNATGNFFAGTPSRKAKPSLLSQGVATRAGAGPHKSSSWILHKRLMSAALRLRQMLLRRNQRVCMCSRSPFQVPQFTD
jgi:hypothetical protein